MLRSLTSRTVSGCVLGGLALSALSLSSSITRPPAPRSAVAAGQLLSLPLAFERNEGQAGGEVRYLSRGASSTLLLTGNETVLRLRGSEEANVRMRLAGGNPAPESTVEQKLPGVSHYYLGSDPQRWRRGVEQFARVRFAEVYDGVDLVYYGQQGALEYDFVVQPGADPEKIRLQFTGAEQARLSDEGDLLLSTPAGEVRQRRPVVYQEIAGQRREVSGHYLLASAESAVSFKLGEYDRTRPLVIDPVLGYSTYMGGSGADYGADIKVDAQGYLYVTGRTASANFPTANSRQGYVGTSGQPGAEGADVFVTKLTPAGDQLVFSTYLGGTGVDQANALALDPSGGVCVTGLTSSVNFPTQAALQPTNGGGTDAFLTRLDGSGFLTYSTYLGGTGNDVANCVLHDGQNSLFLCGSTNSLNFPTLNALQPAIAPTGPTAGQQDDAFITKLNADGSALQFSTYLGGSMRDAAVGLALDPNGNLCVGGDTGSAAFPLTPGARQTANAGMNDAFFSRLTPDGAQLLYSTYFGGDFDDRLYGFGVDPQGNLYFSGFTYSRSLPTTFGAIRTVYQGGNSDGFLAKLDPSANSVYVTYLGGSGSIEYAYDLAPQADGSVYVTGYTDSNNFPLANPYQTIRSAIEVFVMRVDPAGRLLYSTFLGGMSDNNNDYGYGIATDTLGNAYITGRTFARNWPLVNPYQAASGSPSSGDAFIAKFSPLHTAPPETLQVYPQNKTEAVLSWVDASSNESGFELQRALDGVNYQLLANVPPNTVSYVDPGRTPGATYWYRVRAFNPEGYTNSAWGAVIMPPDPPAAPTNLTVTAVSSNSLRLTWQDNSDNETRFDVYRKYDATNYAIIAYLGANVISYVDSSLAPDTVYTYRVYASNTNSNTPSNEASGRTLIVPPGAPTNLVATALAPTHIRLTWTDNSANESGFHVERSTDGSTFTEVAQPPADWRQVDDFTVQPATTYYYRVSAFNGGGASAYSNVASATTPNPPPAAPTNLTVQAIGTASVQLSWGDSSTTEAGFRIRRATAGLADVVTAVPANTTSFTDTGLTPNTSYSFQVAAYNGSGVSDSTAPVTALTRPDLPSNLVGKGTSSSRIDLTWTDTNTAHPAQIEVERSDDGGATFTRIATAAAGAGGYGDASVQEDRTYQYRVRAMNATGASGYAGPISVTTPLDPPAAPGSLTGAYDPQTRRVNLTWVDQSGSEAGFRVERSSGSGGTWTQLASINAGETSYTDAGWQPDATHNYRVQAFNRAGSSAYSNVVTLPMPPAAPSGLSAAANGPGQIRLTWVDNSTQEDAFVLERRTGSGPWAEARVVSGNVTQADDVNLAADTFYTYRVRARNAVDVSDPSNEASARTLPNPPAPPNGLTVRALAQGQLVLTWNDNGSNEDGFRVELWDGTRFNLLATVGANVTTYTHTGPAGNTSYTYQVQAFNAGGLSGSVQTVGGQTLPSTPAGLSAVAVSQTGIDLAWTDTNPNPCGHEIHRSTDGVNFTYRELVLPGVTTYRDSGLSPGTKYYYRVRAVNGAGPSPFSNTASATTQLPSPPAAPSNLAGTALSNSQIKLTWRDNSSNETEFRVEISTDGSRFLVTGTAGVNGTQYTATGLQPNTKYWFRVRAANVGGTSAYSNVINLRTPKK